MSRLQNPRRFLLIATVGVLSGLLRAGPFAATIAPVATAADVPAAVPAAPGKAAEKSAEEPGKVKKTELHEHMENVEEAMKKLRRTIRKPDASAETLQLISRIEQEAVACKEMTPSRAATLPEAERQKFVASYRKDMAAFIGQVLQMETAVLDGDGEKAQGIYKELKTREDDGHDKYMPPDAKEKTKSDSK